MEEKKKFDINALIGFILIGGIILYMMSTNKTEESSKDEAPPAQTERVSTPSTTTSETNFTESEERFQDADSVAMAQKYDEFGAFAYSAGLASAKDEIHTLENELLKIKVSNKGAEIKEVQLKQINSGIDSLPVKIIKDNNASLNLDFFTSDNKKLNTNELYFEPSLTESGGTSILSMKAKVSKDQFIEFIYTLKPEDYMMDFIIRSQGLRNIIHQAQPIDLNWNLKAYRDGKSISYENRYTESVWEYQGKKHRTQQASSTKENEDKDISWVAYRQHFFSSILLSDTPFETGKMQSENLVKNEDVDTVFTKSFATTFPLKLNGGELNESLHLYFGPSDYKILKAYHKNLDEIVPMGWGIFGWLNKFIFIPVLGFLMKSLPAGIAIIVLTIVVKILMSPVQYKQFLSQAKMKVLRPELDEINEKYKDNQMKRQKETMELNRKAGVNPASGCLVGLVQMPIFIALFRLFPSVFDLRHKSFLWAEDLASYDVIAELPFKIPFYGAHISLFPLLASAAIFVYMMLNTNPQNMPKQPGMPDMRYIMYISPIFMLFFFNSYPSGLSVYYLTSNLISIGIVLVIKNFILDEDKIHDKIQENKKKPKKQNRFQRKMQEMMEEAEKQQRARR